MNAASEDIKDMLESESGLGLVHKTNLFVGREVAFPDDCVTIYDTPGFPVEITITNDARLYRPTLQICVRNKSYNQGYALILGIVDALHGRGPETWNGTVYNSIVCVGDPALLEWDANSRARFITNFNIMRTRGS